MSKQAFEQGEWQKVINAHLLESHDPAEWLRYGVALLQTITPGPEVGKQQQQAALAFVQAQREGATSEMVVDSQRYSALLSLQEALILTGLEPTADQLHNLIRFQQRLAGRRLISKGKPSIRTVHHLACTGGTVISKCLSAMPNVVLLSEVNPLNRFGSDFEPTNPLLLLERNYRKLTVKEIKEEFLRQMLKAVKICMNDGVDLVIRDHSHTDFCMGDGPSKFTPICDFLAEDYQLQSVVTVRHPLDSYLGLLAQGWQLQFQPSRLDEYCRRYLAFLDRYSDLEVMKYEDFCLRPDVFMQHICRVLELDYDPGYRERFGALRLSGDCGRTSSTEISLRSRRKVPDDLLKQLKESSDYFLLLDRLDYRDD